MIAVVRLGLHVVHDALVLRLQRAQQARQVSSNAGGMARLGWLYACRSVAVDCSERRSCQPVAESQAAHAARRHNIPESQLQAVDEGHEQV